MSRKKAGGSTKNGRNSNPQYRGLKVYGGTIVQSGRILLRQVGNTFHPGVNVGQGKDFTLFALTEGRVVFKSKGRSNRRKQLVHVLQNNTAQTNTQTNPTAKQA
ncbi:MAG: 50S ribosomal protein L27 [Proteobacteria bacterium]|nr:50S ribosomal protein L27 [Pseudomonadota bacterium]